MNKVTSQSEQAEARKTEADIPGLCTRHSYCRTIWDAEKCSECPVCRQQQEMFLMLRSAQKRVQELQFEIAELKEAAVCTTCGGDGTVICGLCDGAGRICGTVCPRCEGGEQPCPDCKEEKTP